MSRLLPILYNTPMVQALLAGNKTQTRRINKDGSAFSVPDMSFFDPCRRTYAVRNYEDFEQEHQISLVEAPVPICPGDILWVRETWTKLYWVDMEGYTHYDQPMYYYAADGTPDIILRDEDGFEEEDQRIRWRPSIHMPREAARIFLRVTDVRVERLQTIRLEDCVSEGAVKRPNITKRGDLVLHSRYRKEFADLWNSTVKAADRNRHGWDANPWVWVYTFKRIPKEDAP